MVLRRELAPHCMNRLFVQPSRECSSLVLSSTWRASSITSVAAGAAPNDRTQHTKRRGRAPATATFIFARAAALHLACHLHVVTPRTWPALSCRVAVRHNQPPRSHTPGAWRLVEKSDALSITTASAMTAQRSRSSYLESGTVRSLKHTCLVFTQKLPVSTLRRSNLDQNFPGSRIRSQI